MPLLAPALGVAAAILAKQGFRRPAAALAIALATFLASLFWRARRVMTTLQRVAAAGGVALLIVGGLIGMSGTARAADHDTPSVSLRVWENEATGERYAEIEAFAPLLREQLGSGTVHVYFNPETLTAVVDSHPLVPEDTRLVEVPIDQQVLNLMIDDLLPTSFYSESPDASGECAKSCYDMRRASTTYHSIYKTNLDAGQDGALSDGAVVAGSALLGFAAGSLLTTTTTVGAAGTSVVTVALSSNPAGWAILALGAAVVVGGAAIHYMNQRDEARAAAETWAGNPANGCPGCGYVSGTFGWWYDNAADMCVNPDCVPPPGDAPEPPPEQGGGEGGSDSGSSTGGSPGGDSGVITTPGDNGPPGGDSAGGIVTGGGNDGNDPCPDGELVQDSGLSCEVFCDPVSDETACDACIVESEIVWSICSEGVAVPEPEDTETESE